MENVDEKLLTRFLLADLSEESRLQIEERFFSDDRFYEQLVAVQEELADDYVHDRLPAIERAQFEQTFLKSPRRRQRVEFAVAFSQALAGVDGGTLPGPAPRLSWWTSWVRFLSLPSTRVAAFASAAALALLIGAAWLLIENRRLSNRVREARAENQSLSQRSSVTDTEAQEKRAELEREIAALRSQGGALEAKVQQKQQELETLRRAQPRDPDSSAIAAFILTPGLTRATDEPEKLIIPTTARSISIQLDLEREEHYQSFVAEIRTARGNLVWSKSGLVLRPTSYGRAVFLAIPAKAVSNGEYEVTLSGAGSGKVEAVGYYYFIALKR